MISSKIVSALLLLSLGVFASSAKKSSGGHRKRAPNANQQRLLHPIWPWVGVQNSHGKSITADHPKKRVAKVWSKVVFSEGELRSHSH